MRYNSHRKVKSMRVPVTSNRVLIAASLGLLITIGVLMLICLGCINLENKVWAELQVKSVTAPSIHTIPPWKMKFFRGGEPNFIHHPHAMVCGNFGPYLVVANSGSGTISMITGDAPIATVNVGHHHPWFPAFNPYNGDWYVTDEYEDIVYVIHWDITPPGPPGWTWSVQGRIVTTVDVGGGPGLVSNSLAYDPDNHYMYVTALPSGQFLGTVSAIDPSSNRVVGSPITVGRDPRGIVYDPDNKYMYVANAQDGTVSVIDPSSNRVVGSPITVGAPLDAPRGIAYDPDSKDIYVTNPNYAVNVIDPSSNRVIASPRVGGLGPVGIADIYDSNGHTRLFVLSKGEQGGPVGENGTVSVIDPSSNTVVGNPITVGKNPSGITADYWRWGIHVTNTGDGTVSWISNISPFSVVETQQVGPGPTGIGGGEDCQGMIINRHELSHVHPHLVHHLVHP
jgi:YVTN family beta-propeller protein